jgi:hypothetical protein
VDDPDAIWKPGYDGPSPILRPAGDRPDERSPGRTDRAEPDDERDDRSWRRRIGVGVALGAVLVAAVVVLDPLGSRDESARDAAAVVSTTERRVDESVAVEPSSPSAEPPDPSVFGGPAGRRLPAGAATLWSVDIDDAGDHWVEVVGRELVVAAVETVETGGADASAPPITTLVALDALTGEQRWSSELAAPALDVTVVGAVDDVLVLEQPGADGPTITGVDVVTGEPRWVADAAPNDGHVGLIGTALVARLPSPPDRLVSLIDAVSGREVGAIVSDPMAAGRPGGWSTDRRGRWFVVDDGVVAAYDLQAGLGEGRVVGPVDDASEPRIVVDDRLAIVADSGAITLEGAGGRDPVTVSGELPEPVRSLTPVSDSNFVVTGPGSIVGASLEGDAVTVTWSLSEGAVVDDHPVEGGTLLQVATSGGAGMQLVDGLTGETVEHLTMLPGALRALVVAGDGLVVLSTSDLGAEVAGLDLDGRQRWSIAGSTPVVVGDRIVVRATSDDLADGTSSRSSSRLRITAHGDLD